MSDDYEVVDHAETALDDAAILDKIREWLQPTDYLAESGEFRRHLSSQAPDTGLWICDTDEYRKWHDSDHGSLWIKGIPGVGKSVIAASLVQHLRTTEQYPVLFFFFRNIISVNFSPRALIKDWLAQLLPHSAKLQFALQTRLELETALTEISDDDLFQHFLDGLSCVPKVYCIADALDEMESDSRQRLFLDRLNSLGTYRPASLKLLMTSRPKRHLQSALRDSSIVHISLQRRLVDIDIVAYLRHRLGDRALSALHHDVTTDVAKRQHIIDMVARRSEGLFLYAKLAVDQVVRDFVTNKDFSHVNSIEALEASLPVGLEQTYSAMLAKQRDKNGVSVDLQIHVLEAVTHSARPLRLNELTSLIKCVCPDINAPPGGLKPFIAGCCGSLVEVMEDETLQVIHHSFTEFLRGDNRSSGQSADRAEDIPLIDSDRAHKRMAMNCLRYLKSGAMLRDGESDTGDSEEKEPLNYQDARLLHPFLAYAVEHWPYHAKHYDVHDDELFAAIMSFLDPNSLTFLRWLSLQWGIAAKSRGNTGGIPHAIHVAAFAGLSKFAMALLAQDPASVSVVDVQQRVPLHWAAANGHAEVASLLIEHGSNPNAEDTRGLKPIHLAAQRNHVAVLKRLLEAGVEPDTIKTKENRNGRLLGGQRITRGEDAILYACKRGHTECLREMIPFCTPEMLERLLCECCRCGRSDAVLAILEGSNVSPNATYQQATALYFACKSADVKSAIALIQRGADVGKTSTWHPPRRINGGPPPFAESTSAPIHALVNVWRESNDEACRAILQSLIGAGADLEQLDGNGETALFLAVGNMEYGSYPARRPLRLPALRALLEAGADVHRTRKGKTALHIASMFNNLEAIQLLVERGCDLNQKDQNQDTPLLCAMRDGREGTKAGAAIVNYFLAQGVVDLSSRNKYGDTAVGLAMSIQFDMFKTLLAHCKDIMVKKRCWFHLASVKAAPKGDFLKFLELLLAEGIDVDTRDTLGNTLLLNCLEDSEDGVKTSILVDRGADPCAVNNKGENALLVLSRRAWRRSAGHAHMERLIAYGVDARSTDKHRNTLLHLAAADWNGDADHVKWLLGLGIPLSALNNDGRTALHLYLRGLKRDTCGMLPVDEIVHFLDAAGYGADTLGIMDNDGLGAVHLAAMMSEYELAKVVNAGADLGLLTKDSQNVLHLVCRARRPGILCQILNHYPSGTVSVDHKDKSGLTPLHVACASGQAESVALLLKHGADIHALGPQDMTALHFCAQFPLEQGIWESGMLQYSESWVRGPSSDPLRPAGEERSRNYPWYFGSHHIGNAETRTTTAISSPVGTIAKLLINAGINVAAVDKKKFTALDTALYFGCADFVEIFATNEELFQAATETLRTGDANITRWEERSQRLRTQMVLARPRSGLAHLRAQGPLLEEVLQSPRRYLDLLSVDDAAVLISESFEAEPSRLSHYDLLKELLKPVGLAIAEKVPQFVQHYGSYQVAREYIEKSREAGHWYYAYKKPAFTALQVAGLEAECNLETLRFLVETVGVDVNARYAHHSGETRTCPLEIVSGGTALHVLASAKYYWQVEGLRYLLAHGAEVDALDEKGQSPLHIAAGKEIVSSTRHDKRGVWGTAATRVLLDHGADPNLLDKEGLSPVYKASATPEAMRELLRRGANPSLGKCPPIFEVIFDQNLEAMELLLDNGVDVNSIDETELHYTKKTRKLYAVFCSAFSKKTNAHFCHSAPLLRTLVARGADLYLPLNNDETLAHFLFEVPKFVVQDSLLKDPCVSLIDFNRRDQRGRTVLMAACAAPHLGDSDAPSTLVRILEHGGDASLVDDSGKTALHHLLINEHPFDDTIIQFINLEAVHPTLLVKDNDGFTPLHHALRFLRPAICELLVSKGADVLEVDPNGLTALHHIANKIHRTTRPSPSVLDKDLPADYPDQCLALWQSFIAQGGSINAPEKDGNTPLHVYLLSGDRKPTSGYDPEEEPIPCHLTLYDKLFPSDSGVDVFAVNDEGETMLHVTARRTVSYYTQEAHDKKLFFALVAMGLDPLKEDAKGRSALDVASACGKDDVVAALRRG